MKLYHYSFNTDTQLYPDFSYRVSVYEVEEKPQTYKAQHTSFKKNDIDVIKNHGYSNDGWYLNTFNPNKEDVENRIKEFYIFALEKKIKRTKELMESLETSLVKAKTLPPIEEYF